jgi:hypothetical protein
MTYWILIGWYVCGIISILLDWSVQKLKNPCLTLKKYKDIITPIMFVYALGCGPVLLGIGIVMFFKNIPEYQSKSTYVLRKFES